MTLDGHVSARLVAVGKEVTDKVSTPVSAFMPKSNGPFSWFAASRDRGCPTCSLIVNLSTMPQADPVNPKFRRA